MLWCLPVFMPLIQSLKIALVISSCSIFIHRRVPVAKSSLVLMSGAAILPHPSKVITVLHLHVLF
jgi:hypothetical protein